MLIFLLNFPVTLCNFLFLPVLKVYFNAKMEINLSIGKIKCLKKPA